MRLILAFLILSSGTAFSEYIEKTRFDRSVHDDSGVLITDEYLPLKQWTFYDYDTNFKAYKDKEENVCYLEKMDDSVAIEDLPGYGTQKKISKILYVSTNALTKLEAWKMAGGRIIEFCHGRELILLQNTVPVIEQMADPFFNVIPQDENDIVTRRVADVVLTPLISRAKRQLMLEEREKLNEIVSRARTRRQAQYPRGRFRGQTQSQYLNTGNDEQKEGKAEAEATQQTSHAVVSGTRGMGQAQSMSFGSTGCEDCLKYSSEGAPDRYVHLPDTDTTYTHGAKYPGSIPGTGDRGGVNYPAGTPGTATAGDRVTYPGGVPGGVPGTTTGGRVTYPGGVPGTMTPGGGAAYPGGVPPTTTTGGGVVYPGGVPGTTTTGGGVAYPGGAPGTTTTGGGVAYPSSVPGTTTTGGGVAYPSGVPGTTTTGGDAVYPGGIPGTTTTGGGAVYPGGAPGTTTTGGGVAYPGGAPGTTTTGGGAIYPGGVPGTTTTGGGVAYPSGVPGTTTTGGGVAYPSGVPGTTTTGGGVAYPSGVPGTTTTGGGVAYPSGVPGTTTTGVGAVYPGGVPGTTTTGGGVAYPGGVPGTTTTGGGITYPGGMPGTTGGGVTYPVGVPGTIVYPSGVAGTTTGGSVVYPAGVPGFTITGSGIVYADSKTTGGGVVYPAVVPGTATGDGSVTYPGGRPGTTTGGGIVYPGGVPGTTTTGGRVTYPGGMPDTTTTGGRVTYPGGMPDTTTTGGRVTYPGGMPGTTTTGGGIVYPGGLQGTTTGVIYPSGVPGAAYPGGTPGTTTGGAVIYPGDRTVQPGEMIVGSKVTADAKIYPGQIHPGVIVPGASPGSVGDRTTITGVDSSIPSYGGGVLPPDQVSGTVHYPGSYPGRIIPQSTGNIITSGIPGVIPTNVGTYPGSTQRATPGSIPQQLNYPVGIAPGGTNVIQPGVPIGLDGKVIRFPGPPGTIPSPYLVQQGQYPGGTTWQGYQGQTIPDVTGGVNGQGEYINRGQGVEKQYPPGMRPTNTEEVAQYYQQPGSSPSVEDDNSNSQASSSVKQTDSGTQASASSQGAYGQGTAQSQVTGTYSGSGSFSAQAGSSDTKKSAQTEISGDKEGATSNAQGSGGYGKSQAQVQLDSESGATSTNAQSSGWNHGTNSQVQASSKGGMADAQANGEGSTSSQAQIGFQPYLKTDENVERHSRPFRGGGTASAQSGMHRGQSQSQLEGSFQYGITYTGAAQAGSGSGAAASRKPFKFNLTNTELFKPFKPYNTPQITKNNESSLTNTPSDIDYDQDKSSQGLQPSSSSRKTVFANATRETSRSVANKQNHSGERIQTDDTMYDYDEEYDGDDYDASQIHASNAKYSKNYITEQNNSDYQSQMIHVASGNQYDVRVHQDSTMAQPGDMLQPGQSLSGYTIPPGFRGRVKSVAGDETIAHGDGKSQSQSVSLTPIATTHENKSPSSETRSLKTNHERLAENHILTKEKHQKHNPFQLQNQQTSTDYSKSANVPIKPSYYTITNSFAGKMDGKNSPKKYEHRYYTKSSTCGYFTFSCNIVHGSHGRTKICKPKIPTHPDGSPVKC
ncbi:uncharacterized protein LOC143356935 isoform X2 [Halictus rubicundus]|uniref:uncharacterized protein LOC143356935 isoform X2 n=1 Tax=Halictus rubicundus TaxID=77578 RepID=UPI004036645B